jgi:hypothetical protein
MVQGCQQMLYSYQFSHIFLSQQRLETFTNKIYPALLFDAIFVKPKLMFRRQPYFNRYSPNTDASLISDQLLPWS